MSNRTTLLIAHSLSSIRRADTIALLQQGQVIENDTHENLISSNNSAYRDILQRHDAA